MKKRKNQKKTTRSRKVSQKKANQMRARKGSASKKRVAKKSGAANAEHPIKKPDTEANATRRELAGLKKKVRNKIVQGEELSDIGAQNDIEAREVQMRIADLEAKAEKAARASKNDEVEASDQKHKMRAKMSALKNRLKKPRS